MPLGPQIATSPATAAERLSNWRILARILEDKPLGVRQATIAAWTARGWI